MPTIPFGTLEMDVLKALSAAALAKAIQFLHEHIKLAKTNRLQTLYQMGETVLEDVGSPLVQAIDQGKLPTDLVKNLEKAAEDLKPLAQRELEALAQHSDTALQFLIERVFGRKQQQAAQAQTQPQGQDAQAQSQSANGGTAPAPSGPVAPAAATTDATAKTNGGTAPAPASSADATKGASTQA